MPRCVSADLAHDHVLLKDQAPSLQCFSDGPVAPCMTYRVPSPASQLSCTVPLNRCTVCRYESNRRMGDEVRYVLERQLLEKEVRGVRLLAGRRAVHAVHAVPCATQSPPLCCALNRPTCPQRFILHRMSPCARRVGCALVCCCRARPCCRPLGSGATPAHARRRHGLGKLSGAWHCWVRLPRPLHAHCSRHAQHAHMPTAVVVSHATSTGRHSYLPPPPVLFPPKLCACRGSDGRPLMRCMAAPCSAAAPFSCGMARSKCFAGEFQSAASPDVCAYGIVSTCVGHICVCCGCAGPARSAHQGIKG